MRRGAIVRRVMVTFESPDEYPAWIEGEDGLVWQVSAVVSYWEHPDLGRYRLIPGHRGDAKRWELTIVGPLPGAPYLVGEQTVTLRTFGEGMSWYMSPQEPAEPV
jgi:hypothetical protein